MGLCCSCESNDEAEVNYDRNRLLKQPEAKFQPNNRVQRSTSDYQSQEQTKLNSILHRMANRVIDVSTLEVNEFLTTEDKEHLERRKNYEKKIEKMIIIKNQNHHFGTKSSEKNITTLEQISPSDMMLINEFSDRVVEAVKTGFNIETSQELLIRFDP